MYYKLQITFYLIYNDYKILQSKEMRYCISRMRTPYISESRWDVRSVAGLERQSSRMTFYGVWAKRLNLLSY